MTQVAKDETRALLESAVRKLGPERSEQALSKYGRGGGSWRTCGLARAYGQIGELQRAMTATESGTAWQRAAPLLGLTVNECFAVTRAFDNPTYENVGHDLLRELLEAEASKIRSPRAAHEEAAVAV